MYEYCVSRVDPAQHSQEELLTNIDTPTMTTNQTHLEAIHGGTGRDIGKRNKYRDGGGCATFRWKTTKSSWSQIHRDRNMDALLNFFKKRDWDATKISYEQY